MPLTMPYIDLQGMLFSTAAAAVYSSSASLFGCLHMCSDKLNGTSSTTVAVQCTHLVTPPMLSATAKYTQCINALLRYR